MTVRRIALIGEPTLWKASAGVDDPRADSVRRLAEDLKDTLVDIEAIAIAAPQVLDHRRVVVFCLPSSRIPGGAKQAPIPWTVMVNPVLEPLDEREQFLWERCLSIPKMYARIPRHHSVRMQYADLDGNEREFIGSGYLAALMQHEYDHLDGILYTKRFRDGTEMAALSTLCGEGSVYRYSVEEFDGTSTSRR
jgi:peptide deformylase